MPSKRLQRKTDCNSGFLSCYRQTQIAHPYRENPRSRAPAWERTVIPRSRAPAWERTASEALPQFLHFTFGVLPWPYFQR